MYLKHIKKPVIWVPYPPYVVGATPKCAQTYIRWVKGNATVPAEGIELFDARIVFLRDPLERLESCFNYFQGTLQGQWPKPYNERTGRLVEIKPQTLEEFLDIVLRGCWDKHWAPQTALWRADDLTVYPFEDLGLVMSALGAPDRRVNESKGEKTGVTHRRDELEDLFRVDLELRARCESDPTGIQVSQQELDG